MKAWRMEKLTSDARRTQRDPLTKWFVLAWDAFQAPLFPYGEALRLAQVVGLDLDKDVVGVLTEKKASDCDPLGQLQSGCQGQARCP